MTKLTRIAKIAASAVVASTLLAGTVAQAHPMDIGQQRQADWWRYHHHENPGYGYGYGYGYPGNYYDNGGGAVVAGLLGGLFAGAVVGSVANHSNYDSNSCYRFKTYNPATQMYMSYNGPRHCP